MRQGLVPAAEGFGRPIFITTDSPNSLGVHLAADNVTWSGSGAWPASNRAIFVPFTISAAFTAAKMFVYNGTHSGSVDIGLYDEAYNRLVSTGSTSSTGDSVLQEFDITDTVLYRGRYYMAFAADNTTITVRRITSGGAGLCGAWGMFQQASAFALPNPATPTVIGTDYIPLIGVSGRTLVT